MTNRLSGPGPAHAPSPLREEGRPGPTGPAFGGPDDRLRPGPELAEPVIRTFVRTLARLEDARAPRPPREDAR